MVVCSGAANARGAIGETIPKQDTKACGALYLRQRVTGKAYPSRLLVVVVREYDSTQRFDSR